MTFEHIPPKAAGNCAPVRAFQLPDVLGKRTLRELPSGGTTQQRGAGGRVLCKTCNDTTGRHGREFKHWAEVAHDVLASSDPPPAFLSNATRQMVEFELRGVYPGRFARQVLATLVAASGSHHLSANNPEIRRVLLEGTCELPGELRLFVGLYRGPRIRLLPPMASINLQRRKPQVLMEVAFRPFVFTGLLSGEPDAAAGAEITSWTEMSTDRRADVQFLLPDGYGWTPFPNDFRSIEQIERDAARAA